MIHALMILAIIGAVIGFLGYQMGRVDGYEEGIDDGYRIGSRDDNRKEQK